MEYSQFWKQCESAKLAHLLDGPVNSTLRLTLGCLQIRWQDGGTREARCTRRRTFQFTEPVVFRLTTASYGMPNQAHPTDDGRMKGYTMRQEACFTSSSSSRVAQVTVWDSSRGGGLQGHLDASAAESDEWSGDICKWQWKPRAHRIRQVDGDVVLIAFEGEKTELSRITKWSHGGPCMDIATGVSPCGWQGSLTILTPHLVSNCVSVQAV